MMVCRIRAQDTGTVMRKVMGIDEMNMTGQEVKTGKVKIGNNKGMKVKGLGVGKMDKYVKGTVIMANLDEMKSGWVMVHIEKKDCDRMGQAVVMRHVEMERRVAEKVL